MLRANLRKVLVLHEPAADIAYIHEALTEAEGFGLQCVTRISTALARIGGGGVDAIVLNLSVSGRAESEKLDDFWKLKGAAPKLPIVVLSESPALRELSSRLGAVESIAPSQCEKNLAGAIRKFTATMGSLDTNPGTQSNRKRARIVSILGSKGGAGTTTVALNVAVALSQSCQVALWECRPTLGAFAQYLNAPQKVRDMRALLGQRPVDPGAVEACLWRPLTLPGLSVLFGPQDLQPEASISTEEAQGILEGLAAGAECVVVDLGPVLTEVNRAIIEASESLAVVIEPDPIGLYCGRATLELVSSWLAASRSPGAVIVNRTPLALPIPVSECETRLRFPIVGVIPPAGDDCIAAQRANRPLIVFDPDTLVSASLSALAGTLCPKQPRENGQMPVSFSGNRL